jgi:hypothetical protein
LTFSLGDLSPGLTFSSPRNRFSSEISSPQSSNRLSKDYASIFSPSLFSPFNKSLNPTKMDKLGLESDDLDHDQSRLLSAIIEDTPDMSELSSLPLSQFSDFRKLKVFCLNSLGPLIIKLMVHIETISMQLVLILKIFQMISLT